MLVVMISEKCFVLYFPLKAKYLCTLQKAKKVTLVTLVVMILLNIQWFLTISSSVVSEGKIRNRCKDTFKFQRLLWSIIVYFIPAVVMVICNSAIVVKLFKKKDTLATVNSANKTAKQATIMLLSSTSLFILSIVPLRTFMVVSRYFFLYVNRNILAITMLLYMLNHSVSLPLYLLSGSKYRKGVRKMFRVGNNRVGVVTGSGLPGNVNRNLTNNYEYPSIAFSEPGWSQQ